MDAIIVAQSSKNYFHLIQANALEDGQKQLDSLIGQYSWLQLSWLLSYAKMSPSQILEDRIRILNEVRDLSCSFELRHGIGPGWCALRVLCYSLLLILGRVLEDYGPRNSSGFRRSLHKCKAGLKNNLALQKAISAVLSGNDEFSNFLQQSVLAAKVRQFPRQNPSE